MGKRSSRTKDGDTTVLFKKSHHTIYTQSRTCSGFSEVNTKSGIMLLKKHISQHQYYVKGDKIKRDLSTETGICILRRHYKKKMNRTSTQGGSKSKYSTVNTEIDMIEQFQHDTSAYGNSEANETNNEHNDIPKMMMENFKYLINHWIKKHLLENKDTKGKLESVLYSLIHKTGLDRASSSSSQSTYVLNRERLSNLVKDKNVATASIICQNCQNRNWIKKSRDNSRKESSSHSTPTSNKNIKVISTLSIPKNLHKKGTENDKSKHKIKKSKQRNVVIALDKPNKLLDFSSYDLLSISTKSFTKRCATYDCDGKKRKRKKKRHIVFSPEPFYKSATDSNTDENKHRTRAKKSNLVPMPSLMKSIYADDQANITSTDDNINIFMNDNFTMTEHVSKAAIDVVECGSVFLQKSILNEEDTSDPMMAIDFMNESLVFSKQIQQEINNFCTKTRATDTDKTMIDNNKLTKDSNKNSIRVAKFHKFDKRRKRLKNDKKRLPTRRLLSHCQTILQYFADYEYKNNMKLDIHATVLPVNNSQSKSTGMSKQELNKMIYKKSETLIYNIEPSVLDKPKLSSTKNLLENVHNIIPLLDGADNQARYIFKSGSCSEKTTLSQENNAPTINRSTITDVEIINDINELKSIIKDLTKAAEVFIKDHVKKNTKITQCDNLASCQLENISKGIQYSKEISNHPLVSGIKLSKDPKKIDANEFYNRLMRKSTSYNIIDSESILRVTDMTSAANELHKIDKSVKSLPNSRSMVDVVNDIHKSKLLTYLYDEFNKDDFIYNTTGVSASAHPKIWLKLNKTQKHPEPVCLIDSGELVELIPSDCNGCKSSTLTTNADVEKCCYDQEPERHRPGMGFGEGFFYCLLLWIPMILLACLFYSYVIKDYIYPKEPALGLRQGSYAINLSDLGFK